ncbi:MAG: peptidylprolyl isomerase [Blastomonas sp.]
MKENSRALLREPFVHFLIAGLVLFATHGWWGDALDGDERRIVVTSDQVERLKKIWAAEALHLPGEEDVKGIIADHVREEALFREAERLGLGDDDTIIKRRLAQKMAFLLYDRTRISDPGDDTLQSYYRTHQARFTPPELRSFDHVFISTEKRGARARTDALALRDQLEQGADWQSLGDPFMLQRSYADLPRREAARQFGPDFADALFALKKGGWSMPIQSAFGLHLVRLAAIAPSRIPDFQGIRPAVLEEWKADAREKANNAALDELVARYDVEIEQ